MTTKRKFLWCTRRGCWGRWNHACGLPCTLGFVLLSSLFSQSPVHWFCLGWEMCWTFFPFTSCQEHRSAELLRWMSVGTWIKFSHSGSQSHVRLILNPWGGWDMITVQRKLCLPMEAVSGFRNVMYYGMGTSALLEPSQRFPLLWETTFYRLQTLNQRKASLDGMGPTGGCHGLRWKALYLKVSDPYHLQNVLNRLFLKKDKGLCLQWFHWRPISFTVEINFN